MSSTERKRGLIATAGCLAVKELSPEIKYLTERAQALACAEGHAVHRARASAARTPGVEDLFALHRLPLRKPREIHMLFSEEEYAEQAEEAR